MDNRDRLPPIKVISLQTGSFDAAPPSQPRRGRPAKIGAALTDIRVTKVREFINSNNLAPNSRKVYERELRRFIAWTDLLWGEIKPRHIAQYKAYLVEEVQSQSGRALSKSSINSAIATLKSFFGWLVLAYPDILAVNPTASVKLEKIPLPPAQSLTAEQVGQIWAATEYLGETQQRDLALLHILSHGLRAGEIVSLNVGAFDGKLIFVADTKTNEPRLVPLRKQSRDALKQYLSWRESQGEEIACDRPLILSHHTTRSCERLSYHGIYFAIEKIGELAEIPQLHPHSFRHTYSTELLLMGVDPTHARKLTGHQSEKAFRRYTLRGEQEAAIAAYYRAAGEEMEQQDLE
ncbi:tyrosine recombinase XerC [Chroococcidiopsis cubana SAG 39.79]|uniref:Tyrosine recombinase XerC n=1 Tax=Chroococcidiopsis cubana SAG 39.79 TaxID=388085 RepID=A0AB37UB64_9CYAN|nr:site-specific integrase [Chroococcidiopsis cubana]RUT04164.1 tyrosine recombinase XerC [Chroococcidiopsis cubana SAG 39.79]